MTTTTNLSESAQTCQEVSKSIQRVNFLSAKHQKDITERGLLNNWAGSTCRTVNADEATFHLGYTAKSGGILFIGQNGQVQFLPDKAWKNEGEKKAPKYRSPLGEFDAFLPPSPDNPLYWEIENLKRQAFYLNDHPYILITEGIFKAIAGCSNGIPTISLLGVEQGLTGKAGDVEGKRFLVPVLRILAEAGFGFIIAFDADALTNPNICIAQKKLAKQLLKFKVPVRIITGAWPVASVTEDGEVKNTKGMDDFIQHKKIEAFRAILTKSKLFDENEGDPIAPGDSPTKVNKPPTPRRIAAEIAEQYGNQWKFDNEQKTWRIWSGKEWEKIEIGNFETLLQTVVDAKNIDYTGDAYLTDVLKLLTKRLRVARWQIWDRKRYTNFNNCVLDADNFRTLEHSPGMGFTSHLPYEYKPLAGKVKDALEALKANCPNIYNWMKTAMQGSAKKMLKLLAIVNGLLKFRFFDLQMFVHLVGKPGSGKGTFARLLEKVVGYANFAACQLDKLKDGSTVASIIDKQLVVFGDERKPVGVDSILSLTGGDAVSYREVYQRASNAFFYGLILICSNKPIFVGDTTGLDRRLCLLHFDNPIPTERRNYSMEQDFDVEIPSLIAIALTMSNSLVTQLIQGTGESQIGEFKAKEWEMKYQTDNIAAYFNDKLIIAEDSTLKTSTFYSDYKIFCEEAGLRPLSLVKFPTMFYDLCTELGFAVTWEKTRGRSYFHGVRIRTEADNHPTYAETLSPMTGVETENDGGLTGVVRGLKPASVGSCGGFDQNMAKLSMDLETSSNILEKSEDLSEIKCFDPLKPPSSAEVPNQQGIQPPSNPRQTPAQPPSKTSTPPATKFKVGDRVQVRADYITPELRGLQAVVVKYFDDDRYQIDFGRKIETPCVEPKRFFYMDQKYFHHVTDGSQLEMPF